MELTLVFNTGLFSVVGRHKGWPIAVFGQIAEPAAAQVLGFYRALIVAQIAIDFLASSIAHIGGKVGI